MSPKSKYGVSEWSCVAILLKRPAYEEYERGRERARESESERTWRVWRRGPEGCLSLGEASFGFSKRGRVGEREREREGGCVV